MTGARWEDIELEDVTIDAMVRAGLAERAIIVRTTPLFDALVADYCERNPPPATPELGVPKE